MTDKTIWFITGAGRGMGVEIARAALAAGHGVVATGPIANAIFHTTGKRIRTLPITLDKLL